MTEPTGGDVRAVGEKAASAANTSWGTGAAILLREGMAVSNALRRLSGLEEATRMGRAERDDGS
jgi:hypothetical protein